MKPPSGEHVVIETDRLLLRELTPDDLDRLADFYADPDVRRYFPEGTLTRKETREELEWIIEVYYGHYGYGLWATLDRSDGGVIGRCGLLPWKVVRSERPHHLELIAPDERPNEGDRYEVEIAYLLARERWGQGLATEAAAAIVDYAFGTLDVPRLICLVDPANHRSETVARNVGFTVDGTVTVDDETFPLFALRRARWRRKP